MSELIKLENVRLSFPSLFQKAKFDGEETAYEATFLLDKEKHADKIKEVEAKIEKFLSEKFNGKVPKGIKYTGFQDGDTKSYDGYENQMAVKASSKKVRPTVLDRDRSPLTEADNKIYAGCYVNAFVSLWYSDHPKGGKQVLFNLAGVQFRRDGESFGAKALDPDLFEEIEDDENEEF